MPLADSYATGRPFWHWHAFTTLADQDANGRSFIMFYDFDFVYKRMKEWEIKQSKQLTLLSSFISNAAQNNDIFIFKSPIKKAQFKFVQ